MTKKEAIAVFERAGYTFTGYKDAGWGEKRYHFTHPNIHGEDCYDLRLLRNKARLLDIRMYMAEILREQKMGIQQTLFSDFEYETHYAITNPIEEAA